MTTSETHEKRDGKILMIVAFGVVFTAVCIAVLAGLGSEKSDRAAEAAAGKRITKPPVIEPVAMPAVHRATKTSLQPIEPLKLPGSTVDAATESAAAFEIDPEADFAREAHGAWAAREYEKAAAYFAALAEDEPDRAYTQYMLALSEWKAGRLDRAQQAMTRSAELNPGSIKTQLNLSRIENDRGEFEAALAAARAALAGDEGSAAALFLEARSLRNLGRIDEALESLATSLSIDADNGYAQNLLGLIRIERGEAEQAVEPLRAAVTLEPEVAYMQNNLGVALEASGDAKGALVAFRRAVELGDASKAAQSVARLEPVVPEQPGASETVTVADEGAVTQEAAESGI